MKAAILTGPRTVAIREVPVPSVGPGQVRVRIEGCGVCASNIPSWEGPDWTHFNAAPGAPGNDGWGIVDAVARGVHAVKVGDRVATLFANSFAEYDVGDAAAVIKIPRALKPIPCPGASLGNAINILRRSEIRAGQRVAIVGIGFIGALLARMAVLLDAEVIAISRRTTSLALARELGAGRIVRLDDQDAMRSLRRELGDERLCECVIEATGNHTALDLALDLVREDGRVILAGGHAQIPRGPTMRRRQRKGIDVIHAHEPNLAVRAQGVREAIDAISSGILAPTRLFTHAFPLSELGAAFEAVATRPSGFVKALVTI